MDPNVFFHQDKRFFMAGAEDRDRIAAYVREHCAEDLEKIFVVADDVANKSFLFNLRWDMERTYTPVVFDGAIDWLHQPGDDPEWIFAFNRMRFWICLGQAYAVTKDEKYARAFAEQLVSWIDTVKRDDPRCEKAWRSIEAGLRLEYWLKAMAYFEGSAAITPEVMEKFIASVTEHAEFIMGVWNSYNLMSNWGVLANHGLFIAGLMLPTNPRTQEYVATALDRLAQEIRIQVYDDGTHWEQSPMYHNEVAHDYLDVVLLAKRNGIALPEPIEEKTRAMCRVDAIWAKPDGHEVAMGDSDDIDLRDIVTRGAYLFADPEMKAAGYARLDFDSVWDLGFDAVGEYDALAFRRPAETDFALGDSGNFYIRSGWGEADTFLHFHCGTLGAGHGHSDQLHVDLFAHGEDILIDPGRYTYVDKPERYEFKDSDAHNTTTVDGRNFYVCTDSWGCSKLARAVNRRFVSKGGYGYAEGGHLGYADLETGSVFVNRRVLVIKPDIVVLCDEFYAHAAHTYQQYFHFNNAGAVTGEGRAFRYRSDRNDVTLELVGGELAGSALIPARISRHYNQAEDAVALKTELQGTGFASVFTVIGLDKAGSAEELVVEKHAVASNFKDIIFEDRQIEALGIRKGGRHYTLVVAHEEYASPTDTFRADGCTGFGEVVVFDRAAGETSIGTALVR
ncbi:alginate lyase family protein [Consotaella aegiceratis]|uniref:alginate lyase family protein n=1 Tax=Consotaella aegiceratis TaxID=3097961 RepID=UPI002F3E8B66